jgi:exonuclease SbcD
MENYGQIDPATGINGRVMDFLRRFSAVIDYALNNDVDLFIFAGDAYKTRDPNSTYRREFERRIKRLADAGIPTVLLVGNHDLPSMEKKASSVEIFRTLEIPNVVVGSHDQVHRITTRRGQAIQVATVPYPVRQRLLVLDEHRNATIAELDAALQQLMAENIQGLAAQVDPALPAVLVGHFSVSEASYGSERTVMLGRDVVVLRSTLADSAWDYVALGHIHKHQALNSSRHPPIVYAGSLERIDFGEAVEPKGFVVADVRRGHTDWRFQEVEARRFVTIHADVRHADVRADPTAALLAEIAGRSAEWVDAVVRIIVQALPEQSGQLRDADIRRALEGAYYIAGVNKEIERAYRQRLGADGAEGLLPAELLERYLESKGTAPDRIKALLQAAEEILHGTE